MYEGAKTSVRSAAGLTEEFEVKVGLNQGSTLSLFLFAIIMDVLTKGVRKDTLWDMMFADDLVLCREDREELGVALEGWRKVLEEGGLKVSRKRQNISKLEEPSKEQFTYRGEGEEG